MADFLITARADDKTASRDFFNALFHPERIDRDRYERALAEMRKEREDFTDEEKADMKWNAQMLDGCETEDEFNAELRWQTQ